VKILHNKFKAASALSANFLVTLGGIITSSGMAISSLREVKCVLCKYRFEHGINKTIIQRDSPVSFVSAAVVDEPVKC